VECSFEGKTKKCMHNFGWETFSKTQVMVSCSLMPCSDDVGGYPTT